MGNYKKKIKKTLIIFFITILFVFSSISCQSSNGIEIKRINLFHIKYDPPTTTQNDEVYPKDPPSYIFYRKYYIYFYDSSNGTLTKYSKNGNTVLTIQNSSITVSGYGIDKDKIMTKLEEDQKTLKIIRNFPLPEITGISVDFNDNIYLKVVIKGTTENINDDCSGFLANYSDKDHPIFYLLNNEESNNLVEKLNYFENLYSEKERKSNVRYYTFFMVFNQYGDFNRVIALSPNYPSFPHNSKIYHTKEDLVEGSNKDGKKIDGTNYIYFILPTMYEDTGMPTALANTTSLACFLRFSLKTEDKVEEIIESPQELNLYTENGKTDNIKIDINPKLDEQKLSLEQFYNHNYLFSQNSKFILFNLTDLVIPENNNLTLSSEFGDAIITPDGFLGFQVYYFEKGHILYDAIYKMDILKDKINPKLFFYKKLFNEKVENGVQKITLSVSDSYIGSSEGNYLFYVRFLEKLPTPSAKLIIKNDKGEALISRLLKVNNIISTENLVVGENGSIYGFLKLKDNIYFFYYASEVAINKLKSSN